MKTLEDITTEIFGAHTMQIAKLTAILEASKAEVERLKQQLAKHEGRPSLELVEPKESVG